MTSESDSVFLVFCTVPESGADELARQLLEEKLVACISFIGPLRSLYRWGGKIEESGEILLLMKTSGVTRSALRRRILDLHSYSVPEILEFEADSGLPAYFGWVAESCSITRA